MKQIEQVLLKIPLNYPQGVIIPKIVEGCTYSDVARKLKRGINLDAIEVNITEWNHTRSGGIALTVGRGPIPAEAVVKLRAAAEKVLGTDTDDSEEDVLEGLRREDVDPTEISIRSIIPGYRGNNIAVIEVPKHTVIRLLKRGKLRVGLVLCKLRLKERKMIRCYKCHGYCHYMQGEAELHPLRRHRETKEPLPR